VTVVVGGGVNGDLADGLTQPGALGANRSDYGLLLSWLLWVNQGYFSVGLLVAEVQSDQRARAMTLIVTTVAPLVAALTLLPLAAAWGAERNQAAFASGELQQIVRALVADWFDIPFLVSAVMAEIVLFSSASTAAQRVLHFVAQSQLPLTLGADAATRVDVDPITRWLWFDMRRGTPGGFVCIVNLVLLPLAVWLPYTVLVQLAMLLAAPAILAACAAFWHCRGPSWARLVVILPVLAVGAMLFLVLSDERDTFAIPYFKGIATAVLVVVTCVFAVVGRREPALVAEVEAAETTSLMRQSTVPEPVETQA